MSCIRSCYDKESPNFGHGECATCVHRDGRPVNEGKAIKLAMGEANDRRLEAEKQEPSAKIVDCDFLGQPIAHFYGKSLPIGTLLYTSPQPKREPLTEDAIHDIWLSMWGNGAWSTGERRKRFIRAIEAVHGIKGE